jgi:CubicO group peptidase (beta-lactamase class C family)
MLLVQSVLFYNTCLPQIQSAAKMQRRIDSLLSQKFKSNEPGVALLIADKDRVIYEKAFGSANLELGVPMKPGMVFKLGSITKQFTAVAILQLAEQGKLSLQDSLQRYVSDFPSRGHTITIEHLLTHTSGIKDYLQIDYGSPYIERWDFSPKQLIDSFKNQPLDFPPGTAFRYSNSGYALLGYIIEKVSGETYSTYLQKNIFKPLGLDHTAIDNAKLLIPGRVNGYNKNRNNYENADYWSSTIAYAAGAMVSNVSDLFKWHKALKTGKPVKKSTLEQAFRPFRLNNGKATEYGYGWFIREMNGIRMIEHGGSITGFRSREMYFPDEDVFITILFNNQSIAADELSMAIATLALGKPFHKEISIDAVTMNTYLGTYSLVQDPRRTITIIKERDKLIAKVAGQSDHELVFQSATRFELRNIGGLTGEFMLEGGKVVKFVINQGGVYEWKKVE